MILTKEQVRNIDKKRYAEWVDVHYLIESHEMLRTMLAECVPPLEAIYMEKGTHKYLAPEVLNQIIKSVKNLRRYISYDS